MYLSHLYSGTHQATKDSIRATIEMIPDSILIRYRVPGIVTTITHLIKQNTANEAYVNRMQDMCIKCSDDDDEEDVINATNYHGRQPQHRNNKNHQLVQYDMHHTPYDGKRPQPPLRDGNSRQRTMYNKSPFKGSCYGYRR